jgi:hypothetical protein
MDCSKSILHSPTVPRILITTEHRNIEYLLNVNNTQQKDINLTWVPSILLYLYWLLNLFLWYISDILSFKTSHFISTMMLDIIHYKKYHFTELQGKLPCSEEPSWNSCHESNTSNLNIPSHFINTHFCIIFKSVWGSIASMTRIYTGISEFKSWQKQENYTFFKTSRPFPAPTQPPTPLKPQLFLWQ